MLLSSRHAQLGSTPCLAAAMAPRCILAQKLRGKNPRPLFQSISKFLSVCSFFTFEHGSFRKIRGETGHERRASHECGEGCFDDSCFGGLAEGGISFLLEVLGGKTPACCLEKGGAEEHPPPLPLGISPFFFS